MGPWLYAFMLFLCKARPMQSGKFDWKRFTVITALVLIVLLGVAVGVLQANGKMENVEISICDMATRSSCS